MACETAYSHAFRCWRSSTVAAISFTCVLNPYAEFFPPRESSDVSLKVYIGRGTPEQPVEVDFVHVAQHFPPGAVKLSEVEEKQAKIFFEPNLRHFVLVNFGQTPLSAPLPSLLSCFLR